MVLAVLLAEVGLVVSTDRILQAIWGEDADPSHLSALQAHVSRLRSVLGRDLVITTSPGYVLDASRVEIDVAAAETLAREGRGLVGADDWVGAAERFQSALSLWRGPSYGEFAGLHYFEWERARLEELRLEICEDLSAVELEAGSNTNAISRLEPLMRENPLRERLRALLMIALYRTGRQVDALAVFRDLRTHLGEELGLEPSRELADLEVRILNHDPALASAAHPIAAATTTIRRTPLPIIRGFLSVGDERIPLTRSVTTIGRQPDRDLVVDDDEASRRHAEIRRLPDGHLLVDVGSANGTLVNGQEIVEHELQPRDVITIGNTILTYMSE
jgi:DNA-binding SARP family transcriptional activator